MLLYLSQVLHKQHIMQLWKSGGFFYYHKESSGLSGIFFGLLFMIELIFLDVIFTLKNYCYSNIMKHYVCLLKKDWISTNDFLN